MNIVSVSTIHGNLPVFTNYMVHKDLPPEHNVLGGTVIEHKNPQDVSQNKTFTSASVSFLGMHCINFFPCHVIPLAVVGIIRIVPV
jgi:hypothetical protein